MLHFILETAVFIMLKIPHVIKRKDNGIYYFNLGVPITLKDILGKGKIAPSLKTKNALEAQKLSEVNHSTG